MRLQHRSQEDDVRCLVAKRLPGLVFDFLRMSSQPGVWRFLDELPIFVDDLIIFQSSLYNVEVVAVLRITKTLDYARIDRSHRSVTQSIERPGFVCVSYLVVEHRVQL